MRTKQFIYLSHCLINGVTKGLTLCFGGVNVMSLMSVNIQELKDYC